MAKKNGRPTKYRPKFDKIAKDFLAKGYSKRALAGHLNITQETLYAWIAAHESFSKNIEKGSSDGEVMYCDMLKKMGKGERGNCNAVIFLMTNLYRWRSQPKDEEIASKNIEISFAIATPKDADEDKVTPETV